MNPCANCPHLAQEIPSREWLAAHGLSISEAAEALGVDRSTVSRWLRGRCPAWRRADLARLKIHVAFGGKPL